MEFLRFLRALPETIFSFCYVAFVPAWISEKKPSVGINRVLVGGSGVVILSSLFFVMLPSAIAFHDLFRPSRDLLQVILSLSHHPIVVGSVHGFAVASLFGLIPPVSIVARYNLTDDGIPPVLAYFLTGVLPWILASVFGYIPVFTHFVRIVFFFSASFVIYIFPALLFIRHKRGMITPSDLRIDYPPVDLFLQKNVVPHYAFPPNYFPFLATPERSILAAKIILCLGALLTASNLVFYIIYLGMEPGGFMVHSLTATPTPSPLLPL